MDYYSISLHIGKKCTNHPNILGREEKNKGRSEFDVDLVLIN